jgi:asparagine synthase (glutamine-hydrolysing)
MCGIAGIVLFNGQPVERDELGRMNRALAHRGPDDEGICCQDNVGMAHRRLAIIDPAAGPQPFFDQDRRLILSYNGEVYNFFEIRQELGADYYFQTRSDTEVVLKAYQKWGISCLGRFRGMFAFAIYDSLRRRLYLVRDRVGVKPLFYASLDGRFAFASELGALLQLPWIPRNIDPASVANFLRYTYVPTPATIYQKIYKLEPGHYLEVDTQEGRIWRRRYWGLRVKIGKGNEQDRLEELNAELDEAMRIYVRSDVPFGCFLSGGIDSSLVAALMARHLDSPVRTFSIGFAEKGHSELPYAAEAARILGTDHREKIVSSQLAFDLLRRMVVHFGEPFADSSAVPTYYVSRETSSQVKMVLSGDGGDELFAGYDSYPVTLRDSFNPLYPARLALCRGLAPFLPFARLRRGAMDLRERHQSQRELWSDEGLRLLLRPEIPLPPRPQVEADAASGPLDRVTQFQVEDFKTYLVDDVLTKVDRMSMANSLEVRVPLLDHRIVEMAFSLPLSLRIRLDPLTGQVETKVLLKRSAARFFPEPFLARPKHGFGIPVAEWCRGPLLPFIRESLQDPICPVFDWVRPKAARRTLCDLLKGDDSAASRLWSLLMFSLWADEVHSR